MKLNLKKKHTHINGIYDYLGDTRSLKQENGEIEIEVDYAWDFNSDPLITPTIIHEWRYLDKLISKRVFSDAKSVLSIGGGGSSRTHEYLSNATEFFTILNTGKWDLESAKTPPKQIKTFLIRAVAEDIPIFDEEVDAIEIPATLDHVTDAKKVIDESFRILRDKGVIGITLGNSHSWYRKLVKILKISIYDNHEHHHNAHFTSKDVELLLVSAGFINVRTIGTAYLKLPKKIEKKISSSSILMIHRFISNVVLRIFFGNHSGGMFLTYAMKSKKK